MKIFLMIVAMMLVVSCKTLPEPIDPVPIEPTGTSSCPEACEMLKAFGCPEGEDFVGGPTCVQFCVEVQESGHSMNPQCIKTIESCEEVHTKCGQ